MRNIGRLILTFSKICAFIVLFTAAANAAPKIQFTKTTIDFGTIVQGGKVDLAYPFKNVGDSVLVIDQVRTHCGCTNALATLTRIPPGKAAAIKVTYTAGGYRGRAMKHIWVDTNDPQNRTVELTVTGIGKPGVEVFPPSVNFGNLRSGAVFSQMLTLKSLTSSDFTIAGVDSPTAWIMAGKPVKHPSIKRAWRIPITINSYGAPAGKVLQTLKIHLKTSKLLQPVLEIRVIGTVEGK